MSTATGASGFAAADSVSLVMVAAAAVPGVALAACFFNKMAVRPLI